MKNIFNYIKINSLAILLGLTIASCGPQDEEAIEVNHIESENSVELTQAQFDQAAIEIGTAEKKVIGSELRVNGMIDVPPQSNISINMPYGGFVKYTEMLPGSKVKKGQLLVTIENPEFIQFQQEYLESLANRDFLKEDFERQEELYQEKVASGKNYQLAKSSYLANEARLTSMEERLKLVGFNLAKIKEGVISATVSIYSPVTGSVREVYTNIGKYINPQDVIMDITNSDDLHVELTVYENDIQKVQVGQRIRFSLPNSPTEWLEAEVFLVGSGVREDRSVTVHGHLKQKNEDLKPGMYVAAKIETDSEEVWAVPEVSIVRFEGKQYVFAYGGEKSEEEQTMHDFEMLEVTKGYTEDSYTQIELVDAKSELSAIQLVTKGAFTLLAKAKNTEEEGG
ncbi:efflux RND transporter periplasmic adaptor subunit [Algoriphagus persicinus]|uniref:efflux RND transporter periplasmic adaptor subunit n=1 Tax=Algoriphagus persicinus TaxID=3108754 RepID=UPI002B365452|nr:efflux RND transporter periplasmic adaptor subunit [Algoriphagus sp. E1-3-M2]MEB2787101.1 efflux RND transporter periplasmic adaptor subunit [Algoriphagus sp. E1-3-M2]